MARTGDAEVRDDPGHGRFVVTVEGVEAVLEYRAVGKRLVLVHTGVPEAIGGRGIGGRLVAAAVARAVANRETLAPWCPYARGWLEKHPDEAATVDIDWSPPPEARSARR